MAKNPSASIQRSIASCTQLPLASGWSYWFFPNRLKTLFVKDFSRNPVFQLIARVLRFNSYACKIGNGWIWGLGRPSDEERFQLSARSHQSNRWPPSIFDTFVRTLRFWEREKAEISINRCSIILRAIFLHTFPFQLLKRPRGRFFN